MQNKEKWIPIAFPHLSIKLSGTINWAESQVLSKPPAASSLTLHGIIYILSYSKWQIIHQMKDSDLRHKTQKRDLQAI